MSLRRKVLQTQSTRPRMPPLLVILSVFMPIATSANSHMPTGLLELEWHTITPDEVFRRLSTETTRGLSEEQIKRRVIEYGKNVPSPAPTHRIKKIFGYFFKGFGSVLLIGSILVFVCWKPLGDPPTQANLALAIVLLAVFVIQAAFNAWRRTSPTFLLCPSGSGAPRHCLGAFVLSPKE